MTIMPSVNGAERRADAEPGKDHQWYRDAVAE